MPVSGAHKETIEPFAAHRSMIPAGEAIHHLIFDMDKDAFVNIAVGIGRHAKIMGVCTAIDTVEITCQIINATNTHFPRAEDAVTKLRSDGNTEIIAIHSAANISTDEELTFHIRHIRKNLCRGLASKAEEHQNQ